jgi:transcriptional regulator with XRE-family HTH domain
MSVPRKEISPVWTRSFPVSKQPKTIGERLRKQRFDLGLRQSEAALRLGVSKRTLSLWETDNIYPTWAYQPRLAEYLARDPFTDPALGMRPKNRGERQNPLGLGNGPLPTVPRSC